MLNVLIIEDVPENKSERTLYHEYVNTIKGVVENLGYNVCIISKEEDFKKLPLYLDKAYDIAILDYDLRHFNTPENGWMYMRDIFEKNSHCDIALVTTDDKIADESNSLDPTIRDWISEKPNVKYISKTLEPGVFTDRVCEFVEDSITTRKIRTELQKEIVACAVESYKTFMGSRVKDLTKKTSTRGEEPTEIREKEVTVKEDTMELDVIAEKAITKKFHSKIHKYGLVLCTEEGGVANSLILRVDSPKFYIFSDPLDGSSAMKSWINEICIDLASDLLNLSIPVSLSDICWIDNDFRCLVFKKLSLSEFGKIKDQLHSLNASAKWQEAVDSLSKKINERQKKCNYLFKDFINDQQEIKRWERKYGPISLNAPMISIVLAERHQVVGNVIVNLFTGDIYISDDSGNFSSKIDPNTYSLPKDRKELGFRDFSDEFDKLFICTLQTRKYESYIEEKKGGPQDFQFLIHFRECLQPLIPHDYDLEKSYRKRKQRNDFTPGPGRILFLTEVAEKYSALVEDTEKEIYGCLLSSGEPLTEWVGWFAFLRYAPGISAYCLRTGSGNVCQHHIQRANIKGTMMPPEVASLFKSGMMDFEVLHTGYKGAMHNYTDSIVVFFNDDKSWEKSFERKLDDRMLDTFTRIVA